MVDKAKQMVVEKVRSFQNLPKIDMSQFRIAPKVLPAHPTMPQYVPKPIEFNHPLLNQSNFPKRILTKIRPAVLQH
jgi:hypothetical protein